MPWLVAYTPAMFWFLVVILVLSYHFCSLDASMARRSYATRLLLKAEWFYAKDAGEPCLPSGDRGPALRCVLGNIRQSAVMPLKGLDEV